MSQQAMTVSEGQPPRLPSIQAGGAVRAIVPQDFEAAWRIANVVVKSGMAPKGFDTPEKAMVAVMHGLEIGLTPMNALQSIAVVNGKPTLYGDGALALVRGSGLLEWIEETLVNGGEGLMAVCRMKRKGEPVIERTFSETDARAAGLLNKDGPWKTYKKRMLQMRARAFAVRDGFTDVLKGIAIREEVEDYPMKDVTPVAPAKADGPPPPPPPSTGTKSEPKAEPNVIEHEPVPETDVASARNQSEVVWEENSENPAPAEQYEPPTAQLKDPNVRDYFGELKQLKTIKAVKTWGATNKDAVEKEENKADIWAFYFDKLEALEEGRDAA